MNTDQIIDLCASNYTIGIVSADSTNPSVLGTGTLVKCQSTQGILTCGHVVSALPLEGSFGLALFAAAAPDHDHRYQIDTSVTVPHAIVEYMPSSAIEGPDIAFVPVPLAEFSSMAAISSVADLDSEKTKFRAIAPEGTGFLGVTAGLVAENTPPATLVGRRSRLIVSGYGNVGDIITHTPKGGWDIIEFVPRMDSYEDGPPQSYAGTSGGGIWKLYLREVSDGDFEIVESRLSGVAFWQDRSGCKLKIIGHGPRSIYEQLLDKIYLRYPHA